MGETDILPLRIVFPIQPPDAEQEVTFALDQVSVVDWPAVMDVGLTVIETVGAPTAVTVTVALLLAVPPVPVQASV